MNNVQSLLESNPYPKWETGSKFEQLSEIVGRSFAGSKISPAEPGVAWLLRDLGIPDSDEGRSAVFGYIMAFAIKEAMRKKGMSFCHMNDNTNQLESAAVFREYDPQIEHAPKSTWASFMDDFSNISLWLGKQLQGKCPKPFDKMYSPAFETFIKRGEKLDIALKEAHENYGPKDKHWYVFNIAVGPECQGKGYGKQLLKQLAEISDTTGMALYLECSGEKNKSFYERNGYKHTGTTVVVDVNEKEGVPIFSMVREPPFETKNLQ